MIPNITNQNVNTNNQNSNDLENLFEFIMEDIHSEDSSFNKFYIATILKEYVDKATPEQKEILRSAILDKNYEKVMEIISGKKDNGS